MTPREIAEKIIADITEEYGDETFIGRGYSAGDAIEIAIEEALLEERERAIRECANIVNCHCGSIHIHTIAFESLRDKILSLLPAKEQKGE